MGFTIRTDPNMKCPRCGERDVMCAKGATTSWNCVVCGVFDQEPDVIYRPPPRIVPVPTSMKAVHAIASRRFERGLAYVCEACYQAECLRVGMELDCKSIGFSERECDLCSPGPLIKWRPQPYVFPGMLPGVPVGFILQSRVPLPPSPVDGWLLCDGATYSRDLYPELYTALARLVGLTSEHTMTTPFIPGAWIKARP